MFEYFWEKHNRGPGIFFQNGVEWSKQRSVLSKRLLVPRSLHQHTPEINNIASDFVTRLKTLRVAEATSETIHEVENIDDELFKFSFESVAFVIFNRRFGAIGDGADPKIKEFIKATGTTSGNVEPTAYWPRTILDYYHTESYKKFASSFERMYQLAEFFINQQLERDDEQSSLENDCEVGVLKYLLYVDKLTPKDALCSVIDVMFAGIDTTSNTMQWVLYELAKNPDKRATLFDEVKTVLPDCPSVTKVTRRDLQNLPYLKAVVKETLRLHPVLNEVHRHLAEESVLSGYKVPAGTTVMIMTYVMGRDPGLFDQPEQFLPERWIRSDKGTCNAFHKFSSRPFGVGRRMCVGRHLAELELHVLLAHVLLNFQLKYPENESMKPVARGILIPEKPVRVKFIDREGILLD